MRKTKKRGRGKPAYRPTAKSRSRVRLLAACNISEEVIAARLSVCRNTLRKHYADELDFGSDMARSENLERLNTAAEKGNVTAQKYLDATFRLTAAKDSFVKPVRHLGKKEIAREAAITAGDESDWGNDLKAPAGSLPN